MFPALEPIRDFFGRAQWAERDVVTVFAAPDRAHEPAAAAFAKRLGLKRQQVQDQPLPVPFMSIWRSHPAYDQTRDSRAVIRGFNVDVKAGTALKMRFPQPQACDVQVDLWCGEGGVRIAECVALQIDSQFATESVYLPIDWSLDKWYTKGFEPFAYMKAYGQTRGRLIRTQGWTDNTSLEYAAGNKEVRLSWAGRYEFYIPYRPEEARIVRDVFLDFYDQDSNKLLETINVSAED